MRLIPDRRLDARFGKTFGVADGQILGAPVAVVDQPHALGRAAFMNCLFQSIQNEASMGRTADPPAHDAAGIGVDADQAAWTNFVVFSAPSHAFSGRVVEAHEPVCIQAFRAELAVRALDKGIVGRFAQPREVQGDVALVGPEVKVTGDELAALVDPDRPRQADFGADPFEHLNQFRGEEADLRVAALGSPHVSSPIPDTILNWKIPARSGPANGKQVTRPKPYQPNNTFALLH